MKKKKNKAKQVVVVPHVIQTVEEQKNSGNTKTYAFYEEYHDSSYIDSHDKRTTVKLKEHGEDRIYYLQNDVNKELVVYKIDDGLIKAKDAKDNKCDYGIYTEDELLILVELKGGNYKKAIQQLTNTTNILGLNGTNKIKKLLVRTVLSNARSVPNITSTDLARLKQIITKYNCGFKDEYIGKGTQQFEDILSKI